MMTLWTYLQYAIGILYFEIIFLHTVYAGDPPVAAPFVFPPGLKEGERASATCTIKSGDRPVEFHWIKDGQDVFESTSVRIQSVEDYSILLIQSVVPESSGNYTCVIKNPHGSDRYSASLTVSAPPIWIKEPSDILVSEGESITIECSADGIPVPQIKWIRNGAVDSEINIGPSPEAIFVTSGKLVINKVEAGMQGSYTCTAENGVGKPITKIITITVRGRCYFSTS